MPPYACNAYECDCDGFLRGYTPTQCAICLHPQAAHPSVNVPHKARLNQHTKPDNEVESVVLTADTEPSAASVRKGKCTKGHFSNLARHP
jgi:hypothetical protein